MSHLPLVPTYGKCLVIKFPKLAYIYCDKLTGDPIVGRSGKVYLMGRKPTKARCVAVGHYFDRLVLARRVRLTFMQDN